MKTVAYILLFIVMPLSSVAQSDSTVENIQTTEHEVKVEKPAEAKKGDSLNAETKAQVLDLNYKKSIDLTSIKAFRKSLQIKTKAVKTC